MIPSCVAWLEKKCSSIPLLISLYARPYKEVLHREIELAKITENDVVLNIGCGSIPFTSIYVSQATGADVIAMDYDEVALERAEACLKKIGYREKIQLCQGDGSRKIPVDYTVALVALQARPKEGIYRRLIERGEPHARLIFRQARKEYHKYYDVLPATYTPQAVALQEMKTFDRSLLFCRERRDR